MYYRILIQPKDIRRFKECADNMGLHNVISEYYPKSRKYINFETILTDEDITMLLLAVEGLIILKI